MARIKPTSGSTTTNGNGNTFSASSSSLSSSSSACSSSRHHQQQLRAMDDLSKAGSVPVSSHPEATGVLHPATTTISTSTGNVSHSDRLSTTNGNHSNLSHHPGDSSINTARFADLVMPPRHVSVWTVEDVAWWLEANHFADYVPLFCDQHRIDGPVLLTLTDHDLRHEPLGLTVFGDIKRLSLAFKHLREFYRVNEEDSALPKAGKLSRSNVINNNSNNKTVTKVPQQHVTKVTHQPQHYHQQPTNHQHHHHYQAVTNNDKIMNNGGRRVQLGSGEQRKYQVPFRQNAQQPHLVANGNVTLPPASSDDDDEEETFLYEVEEEEEESVLEPMGGSPSPCSSTSTSMSSFDSDSGTSTKYSDELDLSEERTSHFEATLYDSHLNQRVQTRIVPTMTTGNELANLVATHHPSYQQLTTTSGLHHLQAHTHLTGQYMPPTSRVAHSSQHQSRRKARHRHHHHHHHHHHHRELKPEAWKAVVAMVYFLASTWVTAIVMVIVHDRVPDMDTYPPLPDILLDNLPRIPWAFAMCELCGLVLFLIWAVILIFHKHRFILLRRMFSIFGSVFLLRCVTMLITSLSVPGRHLDCKARPYGSWLERLHQAYLIWQGGGMLIQGVRTCGDYMFSGHTVVLTMLNFFITEYTPAGLYLVHTLSWVLNLFGIFFILAAHEHYSIDVFIAFYISTRLFLYYHTLANNRALYQRDRHRTRIWFPLFYFFESGVCGIIPNHYEVPLRRHKDRLLALISAKLASFSLFGTHSNQNDPNERHSSPAMSSSECNTSTSTLTTGTKVKTH